MVVTKNSELVITSLLTLLSYTIIFELSKVVLQRTLLTTTTTTTATTRTTSSQKQQQKQQQQLLVENENDDEVEKTKKTNNIQILIQQGPSYICSFIHSLVTGIRGIIGIFGLWNYDYSSLLEFPYPTAPVELLNEVRQIEITNCIFVTYLVCDLFCIIQKYPKLGTTDIIIHHIVFLLCSFINGKYQILIYTFNWFMIGELSTVFLNIRWILIKLGHGHTKTFSIIQYSFAITFFVTRIILYNIGVYEWIITKRYILIDLVNTGKVPTIYVLIISFSIFAGCILNLIWFYRIAKIAFVPSTTTKSMKTK